MFDHLQEYFLYYKEVIENFSFLSLWPVELLAKYKKVSLLVVIYSLLLMSAVSTNHAVKKEDIYNKSAWHGVPCHGGLS